MGSEMCIRDRIYGDPAGDFRAQTDETTPFQILRQNGLMGKPTHSNDVALRIESVETTLGRLIEGQSGFLLLPNIFHPLVLTTVGFFALPDINCLPSPAPNIRYCKAS